MIYSLANWLFDKVAVVMPELARLKTSPPENHILVATSMPDVPRVSINVKDNAYKLFGMIGQV